MNITYRKAGLGLAVVAAAVVAFIGVTAASAHTQAVPTMPPAKAALLKAELDHAQHAPKISKVGIAQGRAQAAAAQPSPDTMTAAIVDTRQGPFSTADFTCRNMYRGRVSSQWLFVFVGASQDALGSKHSAVRVYAQPDGGSYGYVGVYMAPLNAGPLHVTAAKGAVLTLRSDTGLMTTFNLATLQYQ